MIDYRFIGHLSEFIMKLTPYHGELKSVKDSGVIKLIDSNDNVVAIFTPSSNGECGNGELEL